jgi:hypothetical protein
MTDHRSFAACAYDRSMQSRVETALEQLLRTGPLYKKVGIAASCLASLTIQDFPSEIAADVTLLFSVFPHVQYMGQHGQYADYSRVPLRLQREWVRALHRIYKLLTVAKGAASVLPVTEQGKIDRACRDCLALDVAAVCKGRRRP